MPARQPLEMPGRYGFHSARPAPWKRVSAALSVDRQSKSGVNFRRARRRCFSVWLSRSGKAREDRPDRAIRHPIHSWAPHTASRRSPCAKPRGSFRPLVSQLSGMRSPPAPGSLCERGQSPRPQLSFSSLEFNFALQRANDLSQLAHYRHPLNLLCCLEGLGPCRAPRPPLTSSHRRFAE